MGYNKNRHEIHNRRDKYRKDHPPTHALSYYKNQPTEDQVAYAKQMVAICEGVGIDLSFIKPRFHRSYECSRVIHTAYTMLEKNGYDERGNKKGE